MRFLFGVYLNVSEYNVLFTFMTKFDNGYMIFFRMPDKVIVMNEGPPWGFRMTGGKNTGSPLKISRVMYFYLIYVYLSIAFITRYLYKKYILIIKINILDCLMYS